MKFNDEEKREILSRYSSGEFYTFAKYMFLLRYGYNWQRAAHHQQICDALMRVYYGECKRLIINIPPRYSKTLLAMIYFMAWTMGKNPDSEFIHTSYSARLATTNSWHTRELVASEEYRRVFPAVQIKTDSTAKDEWRTTAGGCVYAVGSGGTITGYGAGKVRDGFGGAILIDDPHKADESRSKIMRQNVIDWFKGTLESRKNAPMTTPIILVMQRLHVEDLSGWLLNGGNGETWEHLCLSAIQPDGTALWPEKHSIEELRRMQTAAPFVFEGQYQQRPYIAEGNFFKPDNIQTIDALPADAKIKWVRAWDLGASVNGDYTVGVKLGIHAGRAIISDVVRLQDEPHKVRQTIKATATRDGYTCKIRFPQDPGQAGKDQAQAYASMLAGFSFKSQAVTGDKQTRADGFAAQVNAGNVDMLRGSWNDAFIDELRSFPNGVNDDQVDAAADAYNELAGKNIDVWAKIG